MTANAGLQLRLAITFKLKNEVIENYAIAPLAARLCWARPQKLVLKRAPME